MITSNLCLKPECGQGVSNCAPEQRSFCDLNARNRVSDPTSSDKGHEYADRDAVLGFRIGRSPFVFTSSTRLGAKMKFGWR